MRRGWARLVGAGLLAGAGLVGLAGGAGGRTPAVLRLDLEGAVQPLVAEYVADGVRGAPERGASAVLLRIDTPGGLEGSMRRVVGAILDARVPVVCWVGPEGARAASAGTFILLACHVATMAPGTNVGAAHPVGLSGEVLGEKVTNDAAAFIRSIAQARGRDAAWAERAVRRSESASAQEALRLGVIDALAEGPGDALRAADGRTVRVGGREVVLDTWPARQVPLPMPFGRRLVGELVDPNLAFLLFLLGLAGLVFEVLHPGVTLPGVLGLLALVLALVLFEMLPVNVAALLLLLAGVGFLVVELHVPGFGLPGAAGLAALVVGGLLLFDTNAFVRVSKAIVVGGALGCGLFFLVVVRGALRARRAPPPVPRTLVGQEGVATTDIAPRGTVRVRSEEWTAEATGDPIRAGQRVLVVEEDGLRLKVVAL